MAPAGSNPCLFSAKLSYNYLSSIRFVKARLIKITVGNTWRKVEGFVRGAGLLLHWIGAEELLQWNFLLFFFAGGLELPSFLFLPDWMCMPPSDLINPFFLAGWSPVKSVSLCPPALSWEPREALEVRGPTTSTHLNQHTTSILL